MSTGQPTALDPGDPDCAAEQAVDRVAEARALLEPLWNGERVDDAAAALLERSRASNDLAGECAALYVTMAAAAVRGDAEASRVIATTLQRTARRAGLPGWESLGRARLARLHLADGREDLAIDESVAAELLLDGLAADDASSPASLNGIASSYSRLALYEDAERLYARAATIVAPGDRWAAEALVYNRMLNEATWAVALLRSGRDDDARRRIEEAAAQVGSAGDAQRSRLRRELGPLCLFADLMTAGTTRAEGEARLRALVLQRGVETDSFAHFALAHRAADDGDVEVARRHVDAGLDAVHPIEGAAIRAALRWQLARIAVLADPDHAGVRDVWDYAKFAAEQVWELRVRREEAVRDRLRIGRLRRDHERVTQAADEDPLTGLANRRRLDRERARLMETPPNGWLTVCYLDLDTFKAVNDEYGHELGDQVLVALATLLREHTRDDDLVGRLGGDEFVIVARECPPLAATAMADRLLAAVRVHDWQALRPGLAVRLSMGVASGRHEYGTLFARADDALYAAKRGGRDRAERLVVAPDDADAT